MGFKLLTKEEFKNQCDIHEKCHDPEIEECIHCGANDCPHDEPLHYHHDGCPACCFEEDSPSVQNTNKEEENGQ